MLFISNIIIKIIYFLLIYYIYLKFIDYHPSDNIDTSSSPPGIFEKHDYRNFLRTKCHFRKVVPIDDSDLLTRIHQNFRIQFLKDNILPRNYSESVLAQLSSVQTFNMNEICSKVLNSSTILHDIIEIITTSPQKKFASQSSNIDTQISSIEQTIHPSPDDISNQSSQNSATKDRKDALLFMQELVNIGRTKQPSLRASFFRSLNERLNPVYGLLETIIGDRNATVLELATAFDIMITFATNDAVALREYVIAQKRHPPPPPRRFSNVVTAALSVSSSASSLENRTLYDTISTFDSDNKNGSNIINMKDTVIIDDGISIRLHEKLSSLGLLRNNNWINQISKLTEYNTEHRKIGEHGRLIENINTVSTLLHKLIWRAVDDPEPSIQNYACDVLRLILDFDPNMTFGHSISVIEIFFQHYMPWLVTPFTHADLPDPLNNDPKAPMESLKGLVTTVWDSTPVAPSIHPDIRSKVVQQLAIGFDNSMGIESKISKSSKAAVADFVCWCFTAHLIRMKTVANRCSLYTNMLRLLRYHEKLLIVQGVRILRTLIGLKDQLLYSEVISKALLSPVAAALLLNAKRPNLIHSAIIELFDYIRNLADARILTNYLRTNFQPLIEWAGITSLSNYDQSKSTVSLSPASSWSNNDYSSNNHNDDNIYNSSSIYEKSNENSSTNKYNDNIYNSITSSSSRDDDSRSSKYFDDLDDDDDDYEPDNTSNVYSFSNNSSAKSVSNVSQVAKIQAVVSGNINETTNNNDNDRKRPRDEFDFDEDDNSSTKSINNNNISSNKIGLRALITVADRRVGNTPLVNDNKSSSNTVNSAEDTFIEPNQFFHIQKTNNDDDDDDDLLFRKQGKPSTFSSSSHDSSVRLNTKLKIGTLHSTNNDTTTPTTNDPNTIETINSISSENNKDIIIEQNNNTVQNDTPDTSHVYDEDHVSSNPAKRSKLEESID